MIFVLVLFLSVASEVDISLGKLYGKGGHHVMEGYQKGQSLITSRQVAASLRERGREEPLKWLDWQQGDQSPRE